jgi:hypothetical protein
LEATDSKLAHGYSGEWSHFIFVKLKANARVNTGVIEMRIPTASTANFIVAGFVIAVIVLALPSATLAQDLSGSLQDLKDRWSGDAQRRAVEEGVDPEPASPPATSDDSSAASQAQGAAEDANIAAGQNSDTSAKDWSNQGIDTPQDDVQPPSSDNAQPAPFSATPNDEQ